MVYITARWPLTSQHTCLFSSSKSSIMANIGRLPFLKINSPSSQLTRFFTMTSIKNSRLIRKRITRLPSDYSVYQHEVDDGKLGPNDTSPLKLVNRNPRNLEQCCLELKPLGWELDSEQRSYWNKVTFEKNGKYLSAQVIHYTRRVIISVSSKDPAFKAQLNGSGLTDINAARNLAVAIARKCFEAGILYLHKDLSEEKTSQKVEAFLLALKAEGMKLKEPDIIFPRRRRDL